MNALQQAADHLRAGRKAEAQKVLVPLVKSDPTNDQAWYLLSYALPERLQQIDCLKRTLRINPGHPQARARLEKLSIAVKPAQQPKDNPPTPSRSAERSAPTPSVNAAPHRPPARPTRKKRFNPWLIVGGLGLVVIVLLGAGVGMLILSARQPTAIQAASIPTATSTATVAPLLVIPPTWTPAVTATPDPTATITPTPTPTDFPTPAPPGPTALAYMLELEGQVMNLRGLDKRLDVPRFVTNRTAYLQHASTQDTGVNETVELLRMEWAYKALGFLTPDFDLVDYNAKVGATGAAAVYVPWEKTIYVFGTRFSGAEGWFYVHEYAHALVDQHFDLNNMGVYPQCLWDSQRCMAIRSVVEGDATLLMYLWLVEKAEYEEYRDLYYYVPPSSLSPGQKQPPAFSPMFNFPYEQGLQFVYSLYEGGGWNSINRLYAKLPVSTEQILHPEKYLAGEGPILVTDPAFEDALGPDFPLANSDSLGEWETHLMLAYGADPATQLEVEVALAAARGWGGNHYQVYQNLNTHQTVMANHWAWDTQADAGEFNQAMQTYQNRRFGTQTFALDEATCRSANEQISCTFTRKRETIWLLAPDQEIMISILALY